MRRLLVTGAGGFVGPHVVAAARARGIETVASVGDLLDGQAVRTDVRSVRPDAVVHLAARHPSGCASVAQAVEVNVRMTSLLLDALAAEVPGAAVLLPGSAAQYGLGQAQRLGEDAVGEPLTVHGAIKVLLERLAMLEPLARGLRIVATRSFNHVGPGQRSDAPVGAWVRQVAAAERAGGGTLTTGRLDVVRDLLDVRDVADAYVALLAAGATGVVNVCSGVGVRMRDVAERLCEMAGTPIDICEDPALVRASDPAVVVGDPSRLRALIDRRPVRSLDDSLRDALDEQRAALAASPNPITSR
ncbi:MAG: NAD-dependent epimerase/dehydratase family protein [Actinomycetota bacterium]|nr:NAD-dependent epimerase/dehydratase family protein [Actinomycetota bacterium]